MVTDFPSRGQKGPQFWDEQLKSYIDEGMAARAGKVRARSGRLEVWGHSNAFGIGASDRSKRQGSVLAQRLRLAERNDAVSGTEFSAGSSGASWVKVLQRVTRSGLGAVSGSATAASGDHGFATPGGVYLVDYGINDVNVLGNTAGGEMEAFRDALTSAVSRWRAGALFEDSDPSFTFTGAWSTAADTVKNSGAGYRYTTSAVASYSITTPADFPGGTVAIGVLSQSPKGGGATHTATYGGQTYVLDAHHKRTAGTGSVHTLRVPNVAPGVQTITVALSNLVTLTGVDFWQWEPSTDEAPLILLMKQPLLTDYSAYGAGGALGPPTDAGVGVLNSIIDAVAAVFDKRVVSVSRASMNKVADFYVADKLHFSDRGHRESAAIAYDAIVEAGFTVDAGVTATPREEYGTAAPTGLMTFYNVGDVVRNAAPSVLGSAGSQYTIESWVCTVEGRPGTWVERRMPTGT